MLSIGIALGDDYSDAGLHVLRKDGLAGHGTALAAVAEGEMPRLERNRQEHPDRHLKEGPAGIPPDEQCVRSERASVLNVDHAAEPPCS